MEIRRSSSLPDTDPTHDAYEIFTDLSRFAIMMPGKLVRMRFFDRGMDLRVVTGVYSVRTGSNLRIDRQEIFRNDDHMHNVSMTAQGISRDIMIVDDNVDAATIMALLLRRLGHKVRVAHNGSQAIELCAGAPPEIVLMDIGMPVMDGHEACRQMRQSEWGGAAFIVALTGWGSDEDRQRSKASGFDRHLVKPVTREDLIAVVTDQGLGSNGRGG